MADISEYKKILKELASSGSEEFINNSSMDHAAAMIEELFRNAKGKVCILTEYLHPKVYDRADLRKVASDFLEQHKDNEIDIVVQLNHSTESALSENGFIACLEKFKSRVNVFKANTGNLKNLNNHFLVTKTDKGNYALRFETDINEHIATGTFNSKENGEKLFSFFQRNLDGNVSRISADLLWHT
jgi:hypothetical protein